MAIIGLKPGQIIDYIPESERGSDNPCVIGIRYLSHGKVQQIADRLLDDIIEETRGIKDPERVMIIKNRMSKEAQRRQFVENVAYVENYVVDGTEVTDPAEFYDLAESALVIEIIRAMESSTLLLDGQRKNSSGASATA